ncbi:MAG TPA: insulinase family protein [Gemmatimonadales bacterium]|nr:insulinase family protein [Gemmatimonadales bacterium]
MTPFAVLCALCSVLHSAQDTTRLPLDPAVRYGKLENGLTWYVRANRYPEHRAELRLVVNAGSVLEDDDQQGLAHFVEHMAFNGTKRFEKQALVDFIEGLGMRFGAHLNASTSFDETIYQLQIPTDSAAVFPRALDILEDWANGISFEPEEIDRERGVVIEEWRLGLGAESRMFDKQLPVLLAGSRYAERLPIGDKETLETFPHAALTRFYRDWYRPDLMAVMAVGDFDADSVAAMIKSRFGALPRRANPRPRPEPAAPMSDTTLVAVATDAEATSSRVTVAWRLPERDPGTVAAFRAMLVSDLHDLILNQRLDELTRRENPPYIGAGAGRGRFVRPVLFASLGVAVQDGGLEAGLGAAETEAERVRQHGFTATELDRAREEFIRAYERAFAEREKTPSSSLIGEYVSNFLEGVPAPGIEKEFDFVKAMIPGITLAEVNAAGREMSGARGRILLVNAPEKEGLAPPDGAALLGVLEGVSKKKVTEYNDVVGNDPLVPKAPVPGRVTAETKNTVLGTTEWTLSNGVRVLLKPTDFKADEVLLTAWSPGGASLAPDKDWLSDAFAAPLVGLGGLGTFDATTLQKKLAGKVASVEANITMTQEGLSGSASPRDLETLFELVWLRMTAPRADTTAFRAFIGNVRSAIANRGADPDAVFSDTLSVTLSNHHPRTRPITPARIDSLDLGAAYAFYRDRYSDASDFTFAIVGAFQLDSIRPLVERWLGALPATRRQETWRDPGIESPRGVVERVVRKGVEPRSRTQIVYTGPMPYSRNERAVIRGLGSVLEIRLRELLREALGGTYDVSVFGNASRVPREEYSFTIGFSSAPDRTEELVRTVFAAIDTIRTNGPAERDILKVVEAEARSRETALRQNGYWISQIAAIAQTGGPPEVVVDPRGDGALLTRTALRDMARKILDPANYIRVTLMPESR